MSSGWRDSLRDTLGLRLALWYAAIFVASALALVALTYVLLSASLRRYDRDTIETALVQYARAYMMGGPQGLARELSDGNLAASPGPLFVRTLGPGQELVFFSMPQQWRRFDLSQLEHAAAQWRADLGRTRHRRRRRRPRSRFGPFAGRDAAPGRQEHRAAARAPAAVPARAVHRPRAGGRHRPGRRRDRHPVRTAAAAQPDGDGARHRAHWPHRHPRSARLAPTMRWANSAASSTPCSIGSIAS